MRPGWVGGGEWSVRGRPAYPIALEDLNDPWMEGLQSRLRWPKRYPVGKMARESESEMCDRRGRQI